VGVAQRSPTAIKLDPFGIHPLSEAMVQTVPVTTYETPEPVTTYETLRQERILPLESRPIMLFKHAPTKLLLTVPLLRCAF
jgi:hypothetical protein